MKFLDGYLRELEKEIKKSSVKLTTSEVGIVKEVRDGVVAIDGLDDVSYGEILNFQKGQQALVIDLLADSVGAIVLGDYLSIKFGDEVRATGKTLSVGVTEKLLGRVVDALAIPVDGGAKIKSVNFYPVEKIAPSVVQRKTVNVSLHTGIKAVDSLVAIGRGQRELIIGDRSTGKTTLAVDTILSQKDQAVICIYVAIGQKTSKIAAIVDLLKRHGAMDYTIVVASSASSEPAMQYLAPYSACAIGEYFMDHGRDVLVVYDDLTKHAWAYRQISLILRRPAGREAYPGDVFYLHSRLLERACRLSEKYGGGSLTALPIIETLEGDVSSYIPTNVISITDGQIVMDTDLFNAGIRPAINVGLSVSRVGGNAQTKAMKQVAGKLKLDLAQYREMAAFSQFESELDESTKKFLNRGARMTQVLKQNKNKPYDLAQEIAIIWAANKGFLDDYPQNKIESFEEKYINDLLSRGKTLMARINKNRVLGESEEKELEKFVKANL